MVHLFITILLKLLGDVVQFWWQDNRCLVIMPMAGLFKISGPDIAFEIGNVLPISADIIHLWTILRDCEL